uniref:Uncharacterized protein n=1 Tax=Arundo donax TaxID=35708 RepID=A0A0A9G6R6_ARUDO
MGSMANDRRSFLRVAKMVNYRHAHFLPPLPPTFHLQTVQEKMACRTSEKLDHCITSAFPD